VAGQTIESPIPKDECASYRDSFAKELYNRLFNWLVKRLNFTTVPSECIKDGAINIPEIIGSPKYYHIGLLDIFGFEIFKSNSLEQFCINYANERLQQLYITYVFKSEEKEFVNEGLKEYFAQIKFKDNQNLIDMLDRVNPVGIFQRIDEYSSINSNDQALLDKIIKDFRQPGYPFSVPRTAKDSFIIQHTAKDVEYTITGFRVKNKDELSTAIQEIVNTASFPEVVKIWKYICGNEKEPEQKTLKLNPKDKFLGYKFRTQMRELMDELNSCQCHFVRCIRANDKKEAGLFHPALVLQQIKYMGILDTLKVRKESFPVRRPYRVFYERYGDLDPELSKISFQEHIAKGADFRGMTQK